jgi:hypothetical protein
MMPAGRGARATRFLATVAADRAAGVGLWQVLVFLPNDPETRVAITADPEGFPVRLARRALAGLDDVAAHIEVGLFVVPIQFPATCPEAQLAAVLTLPRERVLTLAEVTAHGVSLDHAPAGLLPALRAASRSRT